MAIFGRSKKRKQTTPPTQPNPIYGQQSIQPGPYAIEPQSNWSFVEQRPSTSHLQVYNPPPPKGWVAAPPPPYQPYQPVFISQNYILPPPQPQRPQKSSGALSKLKSKSYSVTNLLAGDVPACIPGARIFNDGIPAWHQQGTQYLNQGAALYDLISSKFDAVVTLIDGERFSGDERELAVYQPPQPMWQQQQEPVYTSKEVVKGKSKGVTNNAISSTLTSTNYFAKVNLYANSKLPPNLPPMKLYIPTFPLLCLAAQYSERVYTKPSGLEKETHVDADWRMGTKAMVIKSVPMDDMNTIVFAIRGSQTFMDWAVNLNSAPASPEGFLDDPGNFCHAGFLTVARKMVTPVSTRLRHLLAEAPSRSKYSLLITGHSAGGAVASLLYSHMLSISPSASSELNNLTNSFKRIHCVTFGAPPVSLLPLEKPRREKLRKSLFLGFVNEGDPVPRADKAYVKSLLELYSAPAPGQSCLSSVAPQKRQPLVTSLSGPAKKKYSSTLTVNEVRPSPKHSASAPASSETPIWPVPPSTLSNAGRLVLLRSVERYETKPNTKKHVRERMDEGVVAQMVSDELLRDVVWGDPVCHMMRLYKRRVEVLATNAVMGRG